ncbi:MAG: hypothetical protein NVS2B1_13560 [Bradyrhizobium sp.]
MNGDKSILEKFADTIKAAADAIVHPTAGTPMKMPLNESGYAITHLRAAPKTRKKAPAKKAGKKTAKKKAAKKSAKSSAKLGAAKARKPAARTAGNNAARKKKAGKSRR